MKEKLLELFGYFGFLLFNDCSNGQDTKSNIEADRNQISHTEKQDNTVQQDTTPKIDTLESGIQEKPSWKVTFIELGSVRCIPCKMMQPIMKDIEEEYTGQVKVVFYDVWTKEGWPFGEKYKIRVIPTQVFLDKGGNEYYRHEGYFPKEELVKVLKQQGVK